MVPNNTQSFFRQIHEAQQSLKWQKTQFPLKKEINISEEVLLKRKGKYISKVLHLVDNYIYYFNQKLQQKWIDFENSYMQLYSQASGKLIIELSKGNNVIELQCDDSEIWVNLMKKYTIQSTFQKKYSLVKKIGSGHFADVYSARNKEEGGEYAVKIFVKSQINKQEDIESLLKEIKILRSLDNQGTLQLHEMYETRSHVCLVTEFLKGGDLHTYLDKRPPLSEEKTAILMLNLLQAIASVHSKGIMHRDLKPENIILRVKDQFQSLCVADFGLADFYNPLGQYQFIRCGTPGFVAPELLQDKIYDYKIDIFSIGVIMYTCLSGKVAFEGSYSEKVVKNYKGKVDLTNLNVGKSAKNLLTALLEIDPEKRITAKEALNHEFFKEEKFSKACQFKIRQSLMVPNQQKDQQFSNSPATLTILSPLSSPGCQLSPMGSPIPSSASKASAQNTKAIKFKNTEAISPLSTRVTTRKLCQKGPFKQPLDNTDHDDHVIEIDLNANRKCSIQNQLPLIVNTKDKAVSIRKTLMNAK